MRPHLLHSVVVAALIALFGVVAIVDLPAPRSPLPLFLFTVIVTLLCAVFSLVLMAVGARVGQPELSILGAGLFAGSVFPLVHGLTIPGVLVADETGATSLGAFIGVPALLVIASPGLSTAVPWRRAALRHWRPYCGLCVTTVTVLAVVMLAMPEAVPAASVDKWWTPAGAAVTFVVAQVLARQQVRLYEIGRRSASFVAAIGFSWLGVSVLMWLLTNPNIGTIWVAHIIDGSGVLLALAGLGWSHKNNRGITAVLSPVLNRDPSVALRLGITPQIQSYVAMLDAKDRSTAGHVTRVAELAMRVGERAGIEGERLRHLGLGALLHDIGKVRVPTEILTKPDRLTDDEFDVIKQHTVWGEEILISDPLLEPVAKLVRHHHERVDGRGYPDGLSGSEIPIEVGLIAVCDTWDAMIQSRHYREGIGEARARAVLREHAGAQWPVEAVELLFEELDSGFEPEGLFGDLIHDDDHVCADALDGLPPLIPHGGGGAGIG